MRLDIYQVDAFTDELFKGNPAAIIPLEAPIDDELMQSIAAENNLSETAFFYPVEGGYYLRWFTPSSEVPLCGHATLASAHVVFNFIETSAGQVRFNSASGWLTVNNTKSGLELDFPLISYEACELSAKLEDALGIKVKEWYQTAGDPNYMVVLESGTAVRNLDPDIRALKEIVDVGVIVTAESDAADVDFVSRYFAPAMGIDEDPVTGSIHCVLTPYWAARKMKTILNAEQLSQRGGKLVCELTSDRVLISGQAILYMKGQLLLDR